MATEIISRSAAREQGLMRYFTGSPCKRGHIAERHVSNLTCMECARLKQAVAYPSRDKDAEKERLRRWRADNRAKVNERSRLANATPERIAYKAAWYAANRERIRAKARAQPGKHRAANIASAKAWAAANPEKAREYGRMNRRQRRANAKDSGGTHTASDLVRIFKAQRGLCAYCRADLTKAAKHVDHIIPLARGGSNGPGNLQYLCQPCNQSKSARDPVDYAQSIGLLL